MPTNRKSISCCKANGLRFVLQALEQFEITAYEVECVGCCVESSKLHRDGCTWKKAHDIVQTLLEAQLGEAGIYIDRPQRHRLRLAVLVDGAEREGIAEVLRNLANDIERGVEVSGDRVEGATDSHVMFLGEPAEVEQ